MKPPALQVITPYLHAGISLRTRPPGSTRWCTIILSAAMQWPIWLFVGKPLVSQQKSILQGMRLAELACLHDFFDAHCDYLLSSCSGFGLTHSSCQGLAHAASRTIGSKREQHNRRTQQAGRDKGHSAAVLTCRVLSPAAIISCISAKYLPGSFFKIP